MVKKDVEALGRGLDWKDQASNRDDWRDGCLTG